MQLESVYNFLHYHYFDATHYVGRKLGQLYTKGD